MIEVEKPALHALQKLEELGFQAYLVGGYVRDLILGIPSGDIDITTDATPAQVKICFSGCRLIETGIKHGTVTVLFEGQAIEITTFRLESGYSDNRHPDEIRFASTLDEDLSRRDFTVNALCLDSSCCIVDKLGGLSDLRKKLLRAIGSPEERFNEDALRILRALRFASVYGFEIDSQTSKAIHDLKDLILNVSNERVFSEMKKILLGDHVKDVLMEYFDVFEVFVPEIMGMYGFDQRNFHHKFDLWEHTAVAVEKSKKDEIVRLAAFFHDCGKVETFSLDENGVGHFYSHASMSSEKAFEALTRLKTSTAIVENVSLLVKIHDTPIEETKSAVKKKLNKYGEEIFRLLIELQRADTLALADEFQNRSEHFDKLEELLDEIIAENECFSIKDLAVNGNDLKKIGFEGKKIGDSLCFLLNAVIENKVENNKTELIDYLLNHEKN